MFRSMFTNMKCWLLLLLTSQNGLNAPDSNTWLIISIPGWSHVTVLHRKWYSCITLKSSFFDFVIFVMPGHTTSMMEACLRVLGWVQNRRITNILQELIRRRDNEPEPFYNGCQSTRHMTNSSHTQLVKKSTRHSQLVTRRTRHTVNSSHSHRQLATSWHMRANWLDTFLVTLTDYRPKK